MHARIAVLALQSAMHVIVARPHDRAASQPAWQRSSMDSFSGAGVAGAVGVVERAVTIVNRTAATAVVAMIPMTHGFFDALTAESYVSVAGFQTFG